MKKLPNDPFIIAEIGINHNGDINIAKQLIDVAKNAGCDAVKFQKRSVDKIYSKKELGKYYESPFGLTSGDYKRGREFGKAQYDIINKYCVEKEIIWFASAWDIESFDFLQQYDCKYNKIASAMLTNISFLEHVAKLQTATFISTGMSTIEQVEDAVKIFKKHTCPYMLMHCNASYPCPNEDINLNMITTLQKRFLCDVGYSGHEVGLSACVIATALGAKAIERHITLDRSMFGSDQASSIEPAGLDRLVRDIRNVKVFLGSAVKQITPGELKAIKRIRCFK